MGGKLPPLSATANDEVGHAARFVDHRENRNLIELALRLRVVPEFRKLLWG